MSLRVWCLAAVCAFPNLTGIVHAAKAMHESAIKLISHVDLSQGDRRTANFFFRGG